MAQIENPPAFPLPGYNEDGPGGYPSESGMTLRDWFAGQVIGAVLAGTVAKSIDTPPIVMAGLAYEMADAMLSARSGDK